MASSRSLGTRTLRGMFWAYGSYVGGRAADAAGDGDPGPAADAARVRPRRAGDPVHVPARDAGRPGRLAGAGDREGGGRARAGRDRVRVEHRPGSGVLDHHRGGEPAGGFLLRPAGPDRAARGARTAVLHPFHRGHPLHAGPEANRLPATHRRAAVGRDPARPDRDRIRDRGLRRLEPGDRLYRGQHRVDGGALGDGEVAPAPEAATSSPAPPAALRRHADRPQPADGAGDESRLHLHRSLPDRQRPGSLLARVPAAGTADPQPLGGRRPGAFSRLRIDRARGPQQGVQGFAALHADDRAANGRRACRCWRTRSSLRCSATSGRAPFPRCGC